MFLPARVLPRARPILPLLTRHTQRAAITIKSQTPTEPIEPANEQSHPLGPYYESILNHPQPIPDEKPEEPPNSSIPKKKQQSPPSSTPSNGKPKTSTSKASSSSTTASQSSAIPPTEAAPAPVPSPPPQSAAEKAAIVFGPRSINPASRRADLRSQSRLVAGVLVPPRPGEPDNCCMSGCVNCVWDRYREELEEWSVASAEAQRRLAASGAKSTTLAPPKAPRELVAEAAGRSMDEDGAGTSWAAPPGMGETKIAKDFWDESLYKDVPVGIREFMKVEKRLKEQHARDGTLGG